MFCDTPNSPNRWEVWDTNKSRKTNDITACSSTWPKFTTIEVCLKLEIEKRDWIKRENFVLLKRRMLKKVRKFICEIAKSPNTEPISWRFTRHQIEKETANTRTLGESLMLWIYEASMEDAKVGSQQLQSSQQNINIWIMKTGEIERERNRKTNQLQHWPEFAKWCFKHMLETRDTAEHRKGSRKYLLYKWRQVSERERERQTEN